MFWTDFMQQLLPEDLAKFFALVGDEGLNYIREPDLCIAPDGEPYIYRWHLVPRNVVGANVYLHLQVASDPERPLHDHPWDNVSHVLAGGFRELYVRDPENNWNQQERLIRPGQVIYRRAEECHRLFLLPEQLYSISLFTTGPAVRDWGFWFLSAPQGTLIPRRWRSHHEVIVDTPDGRSIFKEPDDAH